MWAKCASFYKLKLYKHTSVTNAAIKHLEMCVTETNPLKGPFCDTNMPVLWHFSVDKNKKQSILIFTFVVNWELPSGMIVQLIHHVVAL